MAGYAVVNPAGGIVSNTVAGTDIDTVQAVVGPCVEITEATGPAAAGYLWDGERFTPLPQPEDI